MFDLKGYTELDVPVEDIAELFDRLAAALQAAKPDDRSPLDRRFAMALNHVETAFALYQTYIAEGIELLA